MTNATSAAGDKPRLSGSSAGPTGSGALSPGNLLKLLLLVAFSLRGTIALRGGQWFWPGEGRYRTAQAAACGFLEGHFQRGWARLFEQADDLRFKVLALPGPWVPRILAASGRDFQSLHKFVRLWSGRVFRVGELKK